MKLPSWFCIPGARVNRFEEKAAFVPVPDLYGFATPAGEPRMRRLPSPT